MGLPGELIFIGLIFVFKCLLRLQVVEQ